MIVEQELTREEIQCRAEENSVWYWCAHECADTYCEDTDGNVLDEPEELSYWW